MDIEHPSSKAHNEEQQSLLSEFRAKVESRVSSHVLTAADVRSFVDEIKRYPKLSLALMEEMRAELARLTPGQRFSFDFD